MKAIRLRTEYLTNPIGIDITRPRFYWNCEDGITQTAYQIICTRDGETVWDSGKVASSSMTHIRYAGKELRSRDIVNWRVSLWDENDAQGPWSEGRFEIGLLHRADWRAQWIAGNVKDGKNIRFPVDCFQKTFSARGEITAARLYIAACGLYEALLNGKRVGEFCLAPGSTDYRRRIQYQTYDITPLVKEENELTVELADGWYRGSVGALGMTHAYGRTTKLLFQLELRYADGKSEEIVSDGSVLWSNDGPIRFADLKDGETVDARLAPSYSGKAKPVKEDIVPTASNNVIPRMMERFSAQMLRTPSGKMVLDFGQNIAGFIAFRLHGPKGGRLTLRMGEMLDENGEFTQKNFQLPVPADEVGKLKELAVISGMSSKITKKLRMTPAQQVSFTLRDGENSYCTKFAVFGFRYALVEADFPLDGAVFEAIAVYSDMGETGEFSCSNEKINRLFKNTLWSMKGNFLDVPTDCPTRERLGWTGDAQVFFNTGAYLMDTSSFFRKWLRDMEDAQSKDGKLPAVFPYSRADMMYNVSGNSVGWADATVLIPYRFYQMYGDRELLRDCYPMMRRYAEYMIAHTGHKKDSEAKADPNNRYVYEKGFHLGEWLEPEEFQEKIGTDTAAAATKMVHTEECTAYLHYTMAHMAEVAALLGEENDAVRYREYADGAARAYDTLFLSPIPDTDRQAKLVRPLALGLVPEEKKRAVADRLVRAVENRDYRIGTGFLSTPFVLPVLTESGHVDVAYRMLECEEAPSWLHEVNAGATTIWENWAGFAGDPGGGSLNHYSPGAVCEWLFNTVAGIRMDGENHFVIAPVPGGNLTNASASYESICGRVSCAWVRKDEGVAFTVQIPSNTTAEVRLPDGQSFHISAGMRKFTIRA